jgi:hypothetical protein
MVVCVYHPSYSGGRARRITVPGQRAKVSKTLHQKQARHGGVPVIPAIKEEK